jgi:hypothetical protein
MTPDRWTARPPLADGRLPRGGWNKHDSGGLFIRWPVFIGRREFGRITMDQMTRRAFGAAGLLLLLATSATFAQQKEGEVGTHENGELTACGSGVR